jgi:siroheme synthase (precorrin-2 oxidase/ferrochelatase)
MSRSKSPLLVWEWRKPVRDVRKDIEELIPKKIGNIASFTKALQSLRGIPEDEISADLQKRLEEERERLMECYRIQFVLDHPDREYDHGDQGKIVLNDEDELMLRMKYM